MDDIRSRAILYKSKLEHSQYINSKSNMVFNIETDVIVNIIDLLDDVIELCNIKNTTSIFPEFENVLRSDLTNRLVGKNSLLVQYLAKEFINDGMGSLVPIRYVGDIFNLPISRLLVWPDGFYTNGITKDDQFLIKTNNYILCFDGLPSYDVVMKVSTFPSDGDEKFLLLNKLSVDQLLDVVSSLEISLKTF